MGRAMGIAFGLGTHALFGVTVWYLFWFLKDGAAPGHGVLARDGLLALQFGVVHSLILLPATRRRLTAWMPAGLYGCFFCTMTCLSLLATIAYWRQPDYRVVSYGLEPRVDPGRLHRVLDRFALQSQPHRAGIPDGLDSVFVLASWSTATASGLCPPRCLPFSPPPDLLELSRIGMAYTTDDARPCCVDGNLDGLHFFRQLSEGLSPDALPG